MYYALQDCLKAYFGLCFARGLLGANIYDVRQLWTGNFGTLFEATMGMNRKFVHET